MADTAVSLLGITPDEAKANANASPTTKKLVSAKFYDFLNGEFVWKKGVENIRYDGDRVASYDMTVPEQSRTYTIVYSENEIKMGSYSHSLSDGLIQKDYRNGPEYDGNIITRYKIREEESVLFKWENSNVVSQTNTFYNYEYIYVYSNEECKSPLTYIWLYHTPYHVSDGICEPGYIFLAAEGFYGAPFTHNLLAKSIKVERGSFEFKYEKDDDGYVTKCTVISNSTNEPFQKIELKWTD